MLKRLPHEQLEEESKLALHQLVNAANHQNVSYSRDNFGIDGEIRFVHGVEHTGLGLKYQIKAGNSYITSENHEVVRVKVERKYALQWHKMKEQVILVFYHPDTKILYWKAVQPFFKVYPELLKKETLNVIFPFDKTRDVLNHFAFSALQLVADGEFGYQKIFYSKDTSELMLTNRFLVQMIPNKIYVSPTNYENRNQIIQQINHFYTFRIERGRNSTNMIYTFSNLNNPDIELRKFCDITSSEEINASDIQHTQYMALLNRLILINAIQRDLVPDHDRYYFHVNVLKEGRNIFEYSGVKGGNEHRAKIYQRKNDMLHHAAKIKLVKETDAWYLEIDPDWHISIPDNPDASAREIGRRITKEKAATRNGRYRYDLHFWTRYLSGNTSVIEFPCDNVSGGQSLKASAECISLLSEYTLFNDYDGKRNAG